MGHSFLELLNRHEEFSFVYHGVKYELIYADEKGAPILSLYLSDGGSGKFLQSFCDEKEFLKIAKIEEKAISQITDQIEV